MGFYAVKYWFILDTDLERNSTGEILVVVANSLGKN